MEHWIRFQIYGCADGEEAECSALVSGRHYLHMVSGVSMPLPCTVPKTLHIQGLLHSWYYSCSHCQTLQEIRSSSIHRTFWLWFCSIEKKAAESCLSKFVFYYEKCQHMYYIFYWTNLVCSMPFNHCKSKGVDILLNPQHTSLLIFGQYEKTRFVFIFSVGIAISFC